MGGVIHSAEQIYTRREPTCPGRDPALLWSEPLPAGIIFFHSARSFFRSEMALFLKMYNDSNKKMKTGGVTYVTTGGL